MEMGSSTDQSRCGNRSTDQKAVWKWDQVLIKVGVEIGVLIRRRCGNRSTDQK